jgi:hypothetical protein
MIRRPILLSRVALAAWLTVATPALAEDSLAEEGRCFDVAVVASIHGYQPTDIEAVERELGGDVIVMRWPWFLDIEVEKGLVGTEPRRRLRVTASLHTQFRGEISHFLMLMRRKRDGTYYVVGLDPYIVRDHAGRFVRPVEGPEAAGMLADWAGGDFARWLKPVSFAARRAWWNDRERTEALTGDAGWSGWSVVSRGRLVARRAFYLSDLEEMAGPRSPCRPSPAS